MPVAESSKFAVAVFPTAGSAGRVVEALHRDGVSLQRIGTATRARPEAIVTCSDDGDGTHAAARGMTAGAALGIGMGALATVLLPGVGGLLVSGVLASAAGFGIAGAAMGGLVGALGASDDSIDSKLDEYFAHGTVLVVVETASDGSDGPDIASILRAHGGRDFHVEARSPITAEDL